MRRATEKPAAWPVRQDLAQAAGFLNVLRRRKPSADRCSAPYFQARRSVLFHHFISSATMSV
jgi:hypothetical protein